ncbi:MAG: hypothetical protein QOC84_2132, partial [Bradyrhizobium sp.]|nr:hypothetical protein [Bradyrhizobium sp.]
ADKREQGNGLSQYAFSIAQISKQF